ncbi:MAG: SigB/SigF/SigG family RNA polymerase sigma factor [Acidimicrobiia bacterium]
MSVESEQRVDERFARLRETGDRTLRNELVMEHADLARYLARRFRSRGESPEDLEQVALLGLVKAIERFDPERGLSFSAFATPTVLGELKRHFRDHTWSVRVPRALQEAALDVNTAIAELSQSLGHSPTVADVARHTGRSEESVLEAMEANRAYHATSLDVAAGDDDGPPPLVDQFGRRDDRLADFEDRVTIEALLAVLPEREQRILRLRFFGGLTQSEIAVRLGISQMHVSRLIARALDRLRHYDVAR